MRDVPEWQCAPYSSMFSRTLSVRSGCSAPVRLRISPDGAWPILLSHSSSDADHLRFVGLIRDGVDILMESVPADINLDELRNDLLGVLGPRRCNDLHVWCLTAINLLSRLMQ